MRTIKFRVWNTSDGKMYYPKNSALLFNDTSWVFNGSDDPINIHAGWHRYGGNGDAILQQYIGLKDSNDKELYEGDIVEWPGKFIAEVFWCEEDAAFQIKSKTGGAFLNYLYIQNFQIIGNICENPELLK